MSFRVTFKLERGSTSGLVKHAIEGQVIEADSITYDGAVLCLWKRKPLFTEEAVSEGAVQAWANELVIAYSPDTWRTITPVVGATAQPETPPSENPRRRQKV